MTGATVGRWWAAIGIGILLCGLAGCSAPVAPGSLAPPATPVATIGPLPTLPPPPPPPPFCGKDQLPAFHFGFAALKQQLGDAMGEPTECEHVDPASGDTHQHTTTGLAYYRKVTNVPSFTDGAAHWALLGSGVVRWVGESVDPPETAIPPPTDGG